jgi:guanine deaminase
MPTQLFRQEKLHRIEFRFSTVIGKMLGTGDKAMTSHDEQTHAFFLRRAIALALENVQAGKGGPFGAVIVREGQVVGEAANTVFTANDPTAHAEVNAIRAACRNLGVFQLRGCVLYTSSEPCPMCLAACYWAHLDRIYYAANAEDAARAGFDDAFLYREMALPRAQRSLPAEEMLREEAQTSFEAWAASAFKQPY